MARQRSRDYASDFRTLGHEGCGIWLSGVLAALEEAREWLRAGAPERAAEARMVVERDLDPFQLAQLRAYWERWIPGPGT